MSLAELCLPITEPDFQVRPRVLVVEDDLTLETVWEVVLQKTDRRIVMDWATSVGQATQMIHSAEDHGTPYSMVISDIFLTGQKTGVDLWQNFRPLFQNRFILISTMDQIQMIKPLHNLGDPIYLQKPIVIPEAIATIHGLLQSQKANP